MGKKYCKNQGYTKLVIQLDRRTKDIYFDAANKCSWTLVSNSIQTIKCGDAMRFSNKILKERFDSKNTSWTGYKNLIFNHKKKVLYISLFFSLLL